MPNDRVPSGPSGSRPPARARDDPGRDARRGLLHWDPKPLPPPSVEPEFLYLPWWLRLFAALRFALLRLEFALSPNGALRAWMALNMTLFISLAVPLLLGIPLITVVLVSLASWAALIRAICINLLIAVLALVAIALILSFVAALLATKARDRPRR